MHDLIEEILRHPRGVDPDVLAGIRLYAKLFWINNGTHNNFLADSLRARTATR